MMGETGTLGRTLKTLDEGDGPELELDAEEETEEEDEGVGSLNLTLYTVPSAKFSFREEG